jgi:type II secretory pathway component PulF
MSPIFTPGQLRQRAEFYRQLGQLTAAGITIPTSLDQLRRHPPGRAYRQPLQRLVSDLAGGCSLTDAVRRLGTWLPEFDIALLHAGEHSGRLDACFRLLADYYEERARTARQLIADLAYPVLLFHFALLVFGFVRWLQPGGSTWLFLVQTVGVLIPVYGASALMVYAGQSRHGETWRGLMEKVLHPLPVLGTARRYLALARLAAALEALLGAGVTIIEAWELAGAACGSPALRRTILAWRPLVDAGETPAEVVHASGRFPEMFANQYSSGEISGKLDETLRNLHRYYQEEGSRKLRAFAQWTPRAIYFGVMLLIGYMIIRWWSNYFQQVGAAGGF